MKKLNKYLAEKTNYLEKIYGLNESHIPLFQQSKFEQLEFFYESRERILDIISYLDEVVKDELKAQGILNYHQVTDENVRTQMDYQDQLINRLIDQDLRIISAIDKEKNSMLQEMRSLQQIKKTNQSFHSGSRKKYLDREA